MAAGYGRSAPVDAAGGAPAHGLLGLCVEHGLAEPGRAYSVLTANQVLFWHALHLAGAGEVARGIKGYGRLFSTEPG